MKNIIFVAIFALIFGFILSSKAETKSILEIEKQIFTIHPKDPVRIDKHGELRISKSFGEFIVDAVFKDEISYQTALKDGDFQVPFSSLSVYILNDDFKMSEDYRQLDDMLYSVRHMFCGGVLAKGFIEHEGTYIGFTFRHYGALPESELTQQPVPTIAPESCPIFRCSGNTCAICANCTVNINHSLCFSTISCTGLITGECKRAAILFPVCTCDYAFN